MDAKTLQDKSQKINTLINVAKEVNTLFFQKKEEKIEIIETVVTKIKEELLNY